MANYKIERFNFDQVMQMLNAKWVGESKPYIIFDKNLKPQYKIIRQQSHDGTLLFTNELMRNAFKLLANGISYFKPMGVCPSDCTIRYTIGQTRLLTVWGKVKVNDMTIFGQKERLIIPVSCEYVKRESKEQSNGK